LQEYKERLKAIYSSALDEAFARWLPDLRESDNETCSGWS
jgi:hypothetical protein